MPLNLNTSSSRGSRITYVVLSSDKSTCLRDLGMNKAWSSTNKKLAEQVAKQCSGHVVPLREAIELIIRNTKNGPAA